MLPKKLRMFLAVVSATLMFGEVATAMPIAPAPVGAIADSADVTLVRGGRGGGRAVAVRGGGRRGGAVAVRGGGYRRGGAVAVRGGGYRRGGAVAVRGGGYRRGGVVVTRGAWGNAYRWPPGGAIAAGAAIGFIAAGSAVAYASTRPPAPGLCWYYNDPSRRSGFWDVCP
jgi:hypothetical protein